MPVDVTVAWGDNVLRRLTLRGTRPFALGERRGDFPVPRELLGVEHHVLLAYTGEVPWLSIPPGCRAASIHARGRQEPALLDAYRTSAEPHLVELHEGDLVVLELGTLAVEVGRRAAGSGVEFRRSPLEPRPVIALALASAVHLSFLALTAYAVPPQPAEPAPPPSYRPLSLWGGIELAGPAEEELAEPSPSLSREVTTSLIDLPGDDLKCRCTGSGFAGDPQVAPVSESRTYAVQGPKDNPDPHVARVRSSEPSAEWPAIGLVAVGYGADPDTLITPWGRDTSLGTDEVSARAHLWGDVVASQHGFDDGPPDRLHGGLNKVLSFTSVEPLPAATPAAPPTPRDRSRPRLEPKRLKLYPCERRRAAHRPKPRPCPA